MEISAQNPTQFFTATILEWKKLLGPDKYKEIVLKSMKFLVDDNRVQIHGFVIMPNHIHILWRIENGILKQDVQRDFLKFSAQRIKKDILFYHPNVLLEFLVNASDRKYQFWERTALSIDIFYKEVFFQKLAYIHQNPVRAKLCADACDYKYSSARFYRTGVDEWRFLTRYQDV
jgi:putative transposase